MKKVENYARAFTQLESALPLFLSDPSDELRRDGVIQRFEFTFELAWKSLREYMDDQGVSLPVSTPKSVLKAAYAAGILHDEQGWLAMLEARNLTSHVYDEQTAVEILEQINDSFLPLFRSLADFYTREQKHLPTRQTIEKGASP